MTKHNMKDEIQYILSGKSQVKHHHLIQTTCSYLKRSQGTGSMAQEYKQNKQQETKCLIEFADQYNLWITHINLENYVSQGAEQKVYLKDGATVLKLNDAIYYASWIDYLHNLLLNNLFFPDTAYQLLGFLNTKNHDYYNADLGLILEDLHDENVLTQNGMLYFIDTVFYIALEKK